MKYYNKHKITTIVLLIISIIIYIYFTNVLEMDIENITNKYHINSLYISNAKIYRYSLTDEEQTAYEDILEHIKNKDKSYKVDNNKYPNTSLLDVSNIYERTASYLILDHPELLEFRYLSTKLDEANVKVEIYYAKEDLTFEEIDILKAKKIINKVSNGTIGMNDKEKIRYIYEWIGNNIEYDSKIETKNNSLYDALINKKASSDGFARVSTVLLQSVDIESSIVTGKKDEDHMWNILRYKDDFYYFDSTIAASNKDNFYDGIKQSTFNNYKVNNPSWYSIPSTKDDLYSK